LGEFFLLKTQGNRHFWQKQRRPVAELENPAFLPFPNFLEEIPVSLVIILLK